MPWFWLLKDDMHVFQQHNSLQLFHECDRCAQQSIKGAPTCGKALLTEALVPSPELPAGRGTFRKVLLTGQKDTNTRLSGIN